MRLQKLFRLVFVVLSVAICAVIARILFLNYIGGVPDDDDDNGDDSQQEISSATSRSPNNLNVKIVAAADGRDLEERVTEYNDALCEYRAELVVSLRQKKATSSASSESFNIVVGSRRLVAVNGDESYLNEIRSLDHIKTIVLPWNRRQPSTNVLVHSYYPWTANANLCQLIGERSILPAIYVKVFRKMTCNQKIERITHASPMLNYAHMKARSARRFPARFYSEPPDWIAWIHVIAEDSLVTTKGHVISAGVKLAGDYCGRQKYTGDNGPSGENIDNAPWFDEVHPHASILFL